MASRKETAADIRVSIGGDGNADTDIVVERLSLTKDIDVAEVYGSGRTLPDGYGINQVSYQGTMELVGNRLDLQQHFFDDNGIPKVVEAIVVSHLDDTTTSYTEILVTSEGWEMNSGETTTTTYEFIAMGKEHAGTVDNDPAE